MLLTVLVHVWTFFPQFPKFSHIAPLKRVRKQFPVLSPGLIFHPIFLENPFNSFCVFYNSHAHKPAKEIKCAEDTKYLVSYLRSVSITLNMCDQLSRIRAHTQEANNPTTIVIFHPNDAKPALREKYVEGNTKRHLVWIKQPTLAGNIGFMQTVICVQRQARSFYYPVILQGTAENF